MLCNKQQVALPFPSLSSKKHLSGSTTGFIFLKKRVTPGAAVSSLETWAMSCIPRSGHNDTFVVVEAGNLLAELLSSGTHRPHALWGGFDCCGLWHLQ